MPREICEACGQKFGSQRSLAHRISDLETERDHLRESLTKAREVARDDGQECDLAGALAEVFNICDTALNPENYVD